MNLIIGVLDHGRLVHQGARIHVAQRGAEFVVDAVEEPAVFLVRDEKQGETKVRERLHDVRSKE